MNVRFWLTAALLMNCGWAQDAQPPYVLFDKSTLTGSGNTVTATQVPVVTASGQTLYLNVSLQFKVEADGRLTIAEGFPQVNQAPTLLGSSFRAGSYVAPSTLFDKKGFYEVNGPGVTDGGATEWSLMTAEGAYYATYPQSATWYAGPIANNPYAERIKKAGITSSAYSYGVAYCASSCYDNWGSGSDSVLIGASQTGNAITIVSFTNGYGDSNTPRAQISITLKPPAAK